MKDDKQPRGQLANDFEQLMDMYRKMFEMAVDALSPEATMRRRKEVQDALNDFLKSPSK